MAATGFAYDPEAIVENGFLETKVRLIEPVGKLGGLVLRKCAILIPVAGDEVNAAPLHEVTGKPFPV
ncbi:MAG: hypothetical protein ACK5TQ_18535, partial [Acetobacteraceae bacterium]